VFVTGGTKVTGVSAHQPVLVVPPVVAAAWLLEETACPVVGLVPPAPPAVPVPTEPPAPPAPLVVEGPTVVLGVPVVEERSVPVVEELSEPPPLSLEQAPRVAETTTARAARHWKNVKVRMSISG
jgi:hypothetical protein